MSLNISDSHNLENIKIENDILHGIELDLIENPNIGELIIQNLDQHPDHIAQIDVENDNKTTFAEMKDKSIRCGLWMQNKEIGPGDIVTICSHNHSDVYVPLFASFYLGAIVNGWDHDISLETARDLVKFLKPKVIFSCESAVDILLEATKLEQTETTVVVFGKHSNLTSLSEILNNQSLEKVEIFHPQKIENPNTIAVIVLTSGSTGTPKCVMHSYKNVSICIQTYLTYPFKNICLWYSTVYWVTGIFFALQAFFNLATRIIHKSCNVDDTCRIIQKYKVRELFATPTMINHFCKSDVLTRYNIESLRYIYTGGSKLSSNIMEEIRMKVPKALTFQSYGTSETARAITCQTDRNKNLDTVGFPAPNNQIKIIDVTTGNVLGVNQTGEICVKQPNLMLGYYKNEEETKKVIDEEGWLHTGDAGFYDINGEVMIVGRYKDLIKCKNFAVLPSDLENVLLLHPAVVEAVVVPLPHDIDVEQPFAFVKTNAKVSEEELVKLTLVLGENRKLRGGVEFVDDLPKLPNGKIDRQRMKKMAVIIAQKRNWSSDSTQL